MKINAASYINPSGSYPDFISPLAFAQEQRRQVRKLDQYDSIKIRPRLDETERIDTGFSKITQLVPDILCFPGTCWQDADFHVQQMILQFAAQGHRVFYVHPENFLMDNTSPRVGVRVIQENVIEVVLVSSSFVDIHSDVMADGDLVKSLLLSLGELRTLYGMDDCIVYVLNGAWSHVATATQQKWGWHIIYEVVEQKKIEAADLAMVAAERQMLERSNLVVVYDPSKTLNIDQNRLVLLNIDLSLENQRDFPKYYEVIYSKFASTIPVASIVVVTHNNCVYTKLCLESILRNTEYPNYEIIVVDNHSMDETRDYLRLLEKTFSNVRVILNDENHGFAKANNQGLEQARGQFLVLLNNDTIVPPGWLSRLLRHLHDPAVGVIGPVSNSVGNKAQIDVDYLTWGEMEVFAKASNWKVDNQVAQIHMLGMFCVAFRKNTYDQVGPLDEQFGIGTFEDDDYCMRIREKGYKILCGFDVFVHHFGSATFLKLVNISSIFDENRTKYEKKWNEKWIPLNKEVLIPDYHIAVDLTLSADERENFFKWSLIERDKQIATFNRVIEEQDQKISLQDQKISLQDQKISFQDQKISHLDTTLNTTTLLLEHARSQIEQIEKSRSWRFTAPLRKVMWYYSRVKTLIAVHGLIAGINQSILTLIRKCLKNFAIVKDKKTQKGNGVDDFALSKYENMIPAQDDLEPSKYKETWMLVETFSEGGLERVVIDLCLELKAKGRVAKVLVAQTGGRCMEEATTHGIEVVEFNNHLDDLKGYIRSSKEAVLLTHHSYFGLHLFYEAGIPIVEVLHNSYYWQKGDWKIYDLRSKYIWGYIAVSSYVKTYAMKFLTLPDNRLTLINNGLNIKGLIRPPLSLLREKRLSTINRPILVLLANLHAQKNHRLVVKAFAKVLEHNRDAKLVIAGAMENHSLQSMLKEDINRLGIAGAVSFLGAIDRRTLSNVLSNAHVALLPSAFEGFSIATLEYSFFALPSVLSATGASTELQHAFGHVVISPGCAIPPENLSIEIVEQSSLKPEAGSIEALSNTILDVVSNYSQWLNRAIAAAESFSKYSIQQTAEEYHNLLLTFEGENDENS